MNASLKSQLSKERHAEEFASEDLFENTLKKLHSAIAEDVGEMTRQILTIFEVSIDKMTVQIERLNKLGYAGTVHTQLIFAKAMRIIFSHKFKRQFFFKSQSGRQLLNRLLWCTAFDHDEIKKSSIDALQILSLDLTGEIVVVLIFSDFHAN